MEVNSSNALNESFDQLDNNNISTIMKIKLEATTYTMFKIGTYACSFFQSHI